MDVTRPGRQTRLRQGTLLDVGDPRWGTHHHPWAGMAAAMHALHEVTKHLLRHLEVGDDAVPQRPHGGDARRRSADHPLGLLTHRMHGPRERVHGDDRGFRDYDPLAAHEHKRVRGAEIDSNPPPADSGQKPAPSYRNRRPALCVQLCPLRLVAPGAAYSGSERPNAIGAGPAPTPPRGRGCRFELQMMPVLAIPDTNRSEDPAFAGV